MDIMKIATQLLTKHFKGAVSSENASSALDGLLGDGSGGLDIGSIISKMSGNGGLASIAGSWLGDNANDGINLPQLSEIFGNDKLAVFSQKLGLDQNTAAQGLGEMLPKLIDQSSSGGNLLSSTGGLGSALNMAKKLF